MAILKNKHFGNKVFLSDMKKSVVKEMLILAHSDPKNKIPNFGCLTRYDDETVGVSVCWYDSDGHSNWSQEPTNMTTISAWAKFHQQ